MILTFRIAAVLAIFLYCGTSSVWSSALPGAGLSCRALPDWTEEEKHSVRQAVKDVGGSLGMEYRFVEPTKTFISGKVPNRCVYRSDSLNVSFAEFEDAGGKINIHFPFRLHEGKLLSSEYRFYMFLEDGDYKGGIVGGELKELFKFRLAQLAQTIGMNSLFEHSRYLYPRIYWLVAIFTYEDGATRIYAMKTKPK